MYKNILGGFMLLSALLPNLAQSQSMDEFLQSSYDNHPELLYQLQNAFQQYEGSYATAVSGLLPTLSFTYRSSYNRGTDDVQAANASARSVALGGPPVPLSTTFNQRTKTDTWSLRQNLFSSFRDYYELRQFLDTSQALKMSYYAQEQNFMLQAIDAYLNVIRRDNVVKVRKANLASLQERLDIVRQLYDAGDTTELDIRQNQTQLLTAQSDLEDALAQYESAVANFKRYGAIDPEKESMSLPSLPENLPVSEEEGKAALLQNNFELIALEKVQKARKHAYRAALGRAGISVDFGVDYTTSRNSAGIRGSALGDQTARDATTTSLSVTLPIFDPTRSSAIRASHQSYLTSKNNYFRQRLANLQNFQTNWAAYNRLTRSVEHRKSAVESATVALENVILQQRAGLRSIVEVLDEENRLIQAQVRYENARYSYLISAYQILASTGKLTANNLGLQTVYGEKLADYFGRQKFYGALPGAFTAIEGLGREFTGGE